MSMLAVFLTTVLQFMPRLSLVYMFCTFATVTTFEPLLQFSDIALKASVKSTVCFTYCLREETLSRTPGSGAQTLWIYPTTFTFTRFVTHDLLYALFVCLNLVLYPVFCRGGVFTVWRAERQLDVWLQTRLCVVLPQESLLGQQSQM